MTSKPLTRFLVVPAVLAALALTGSALAGPGGAHRGGHGPGMLRMVGQLDLSEAQQSIVEQAREQAKAERGTHKSQLDELRRALHAELTADTPDEQAIDALLEQKSELRLQKRQQQIDTFLALQATFSPEQQAAFNRAVAEREAQHGKRTQARERAHHGERSAQPGGKHPRGGQRSPRHDR